MSKPRAIQNDLPGHVCFGCGDANAKGLGIKSYWQDPLCICEWQPQDFHQGWAGLTCGGVIATAVDCHCIATATAAAVQRENRTLQSEPRYLFVTGSMQITFLKPSPVIKPLVLKSQVSEIKLDKKYTVSCDVWVDGEKTAQATVVTLLVYRSDDPDKAPAVFRPQSDDFV